MPCSPVLGLRSGTGVQHLRFFGFTSSSNNNGNNGNNGNNRNGSTGTAPLELAVRTLFRSTRRCFFRRGAPGTNKHT
eukprot:5424054-Amphidinium_carterae.1